jgi:hypothetical protein
MKRDPVDGSQGDDFVLESIRRANLDALWAREPSTVAGNVRKVRRALDLSAAHDMPPPFPPLGPFPVEDVLGYGAALVMLWDSLDQGQYADYKQFSTIRKLKSAISNVWEASAIGGARTLCLSSEDRKKISEFSTGPTQSRWFKRFREGSKARMGEIVKQNKALSREILHAMLEVARERMSVERGDQQALTISVATYVLVCFCASLRGNEGFMTDLSGLIFYLDEGKTDDENAHVVIPLLGRFKNEAGEQYHLLAIPSATKTGFQPRWWIELLVAVRTKQGRNWGPVFCGSDGKVASTREYEEVFYELLEAVQERSPDLFSKDIDIREDYGLSRSMRRGSTTLATLLKVAGPIIDAVNRWRAVENARGCRPGLPMRQHYAEIAMLVPLLVQFAIGF